MTKRSLPHEFHDGVSETASGAQVTENDAALREWIEALEEKLEAAKTVERKSLIVAGEESRTDTGYGTMGTPDQLAVTLAGRGLIRVGFDALMKESVASASRAAIFINENQLKVPAAGGVGNSIAALQSAAVGATGAFFKLSSSPTGLVILGGGGFTGADASTGQALGLANGANGSFNQQVEETGIADLAVGTNGGELVIKGLAAGTYTISVRTKSTSGSVAMKARTLYVEAASFA